MADADFLLGQCSGDTVPAESGFESRFAQAEEGPTSPSHGTHPPRPPASPRTSGAAPSLLAVLAPGEGFPIEAPRHIESGSGSGSAFTDLHALQSYSNSQLLQTKRGTGAHVPVIETAKAHCHSPAHDRPLPNFLTPDTSPANLSGGDSSLSYFNGRFSDCSSSESRPTVWAPPIPSFDVTSAPGRSDTRRDQSHRSERLPATRLPSTEDVEDFFENLDRAKRSAASGDLRGVERRGLVAGGEGGSVVVKQERGGRASEGYNNNNNNQTLYESLVKPERGTAGESYNNNQTPYEPPSAGAPIPGSSARARSAAAPSSGGLPPQPSSSPGSFTAPAPSPQHLQHPPARGGLDVMYQPGGLSPHSPPFPPPLPHSATPSGGAYSPHLPHADPSSSSSYLQNPVFVPTTRPLLPVQYPFSGGGGGQGASASSGAAGWGGCRHGGGPRGRGVFPARHLLSRHRSIRFQRLRPRLRGGWGGGRGAGRLGDGRVRPSFVPRGGWGGGGTEPLSLRLALHAARAAGGHVHVEQLQQHGAAARATTHRGRSVSITSLFNFLIDDDRLYSAILRSLEQTHCARMWFYMSD